MDKNNVETHHEEQAEQEPKTFTQEEVNEIVRKRLERERKKTEPAEDAEPISDREKDLEARELRIMAREKLQEAGMPMDLADVLKYSDEKSLEKAMEKIKNINQNQGEPKAWGQRQGYRGPARDPIREAMGLNRKG